MYFEFVRLLMYNLLIVIYFVIDLSLIRNSLITEYVYGSEVLCLYPRIS